MMEFLAANFNLPTIIVGEKKNAKLCVDSDLTDRIWTDRPAFPESRAFILTTEYAGKTPAQKLEEVRRIMEEKGARVRALARAPFENRELV